MKAFGMDSEELELDSPRPFEVVKKKKKENIIYEKEKEIEKISDQTSKVNNNISKIASTNLNEKKLEKSSTLINITSGKYLNLKLVVGIILICVFIKLFIDNIYQSEFNENVAS